MSEPSCMTAMDACAVMRAERGAAIAVVTMSAVAYWTEPGECEYRMMTPMGGAAAIGLGLALGAPHRPVWVVDGDGSLLMELGVLATVAGAAPRNFTHIVVANSMYALSGGQPTPGDVDWPGLFRAAGYADAVECATPDELQRALRLTAAGPRAISVRCERRRGEFPPGVFRFDAGAEARRVRAGLVTGVGRLDAGEQHTAPMR
jgi:thiamine pyrophosphate-dependent acetolactate synthase large subunit-like protein